jgi:hypothetical protein
MLLMQNKEDQRDTCAIRWTNKAGEANLAGLDLCMQNTLTVAQEWGTKEQNGLGTEVHRANE